MVTRKETDFLGFQRIKTEKTIENYQKALKSNNLKLLFVVALKKLCN